MRILITGAASGLGLELAKKLASDGHEIVLIDKLLDVSIRAEELGGVGIVFDFSKDSITELVESLTHKNILPEVIINNVATASRANFLEQTEVEIYDQFHVNLFSPIMLTLKLAQGQSRLNYIINIISSSVFLPLRRFSTYGASKSALYYWSRTIELENPTLSVLTVVPGGMRTKLQLVQNSTVGLLDPEYVANTIFKLMNKRASGVKIIGARAKSLKLISLAIPSALLSRLKT